MSVIKFPPLHISESQRKLLFVGWLACLRCRRYRADARSG